MTDNQAQDEVGEGREGDGGEPPGAPRGTDGTDGGDVPSTAAQAAVGSAAEGGPAVDADTEGDQAPSTPEAQLEALQEDIDAVRRRVAEDTVAESEPSFIQEGSASEDEPVDDTIAPPG